MVIGNNSTPHGNDDQDQDSKSEEDASLEGAVVRHLFQMYSSSSSSSSLASISSTTEANKHNAMSDAERDKSLMQDTFTMENVILAQQEREGIKKISDILWYVSWMLESFFFANTLTIIISSLHSLCFFLVHFYYGVSMVKAFRFVLGILRVEFL
jgi:hypothetical protein